MTPEQRAEIKNKIYSDWIYESSEAAYTVEELLDALAAAEAREKALRELECEKREAEALAAKRCISIADRIAFMGSSVRERAALDIIDDIRREFGLEIDAKVEILPKLCPMCDQTKENGHSLDCPLTEWSRPPEEVKALGVRVVELERENAELLADKERLDWLDEQARRSYTGISIDSWKEGQSQRMYRFMKYHYAGDPKESLRAVIDAERKAEEGR